MVGRAGPAHERQEPETASWRARELGKRQDVTAAQRPLARRSLDCCEPRQLVFVHVQGQGGRQDALLRNRESRPRLGEVVGVRVEPQDAGQEAQAHFLVGSGVISLVEKQRRIVFVLHT